MFPRAEMGLEDLDPGAVEGARRARLAGIGDHRLHHGLDLRLALVVGALPFLVGRPERVPVRAQRPGIVLGVGALAVVEADDPVLDQIAFGIGLDIAGDVLVMRGPLAPRFEVIVAAAGGAGEDRRARGAGAHGTRDCWHWSSSLMKRPASVPRGAGSCGEAVKEDPLAVEIEHEENGLERIDHRRRPAGIDIALPLEALLAQDA